MTLKIASPNLTDRLVGFFSPKREVERIRARTVLNYMTGGYNGGRRDRRSIRDFRPPAASANSDIIDDLPMLRARSRDLARNTPLATGAISTVVTNVVGTGLKLVAEVDRSLLGLNEDQAVDLQNALEREFALAVKTIDFAGMGDFDHLQDLAMRGPLESGDIFVVRRFKKRLGDIYGLKIQMVEADRVSNPYSRGDNNQLVDGVVLDGDGAPVAYQFADRHPVDMKTGSVKWTRVPRYGHNGSPLVLHLLTRTRPDQARGVPYLAPVIEAIKRLGDYAEAEVEAAAVSALFTVFVKEETPSPTDTPLIGTRDSNDDADEMRLGKGLIQHLNGGEDVDFANPLRPNANFDAFVTAFTRHIGVALELPFEVLVKHFTASYSASRAALEIAWQFFRRRRNWLANCFCQPVYEWVITEAVASGRLDLPGYFSDPLKKQAYLGAMWTGPSRVQLDPQKEASADRIDIENRTKTRAQVTMERTGGRYDRKQEQLEREERDYRKMFKVEDLVQIIKVVRAGLIPRSTVIKLYGFDPEEVYAQLKHDNETADKNNLILDSDPRHVSTAGITNARPSGSELPK